MNGGASGTSRRAFLGRAAGAAAAVAGASVGAGAIARSAGAATPDQRASRGRFTIVVDTNDYGRLSGVDGGRLEGDVVLDPVGSDSIQHKHIAGVKYEDFTLQVGSGMGAGMYSWIKDSFDKGAVRKHASIVQYDAGWNETGRRGASQAYISSVTIPALDRASKDPAYLAVSLSCARVIPSLPQHGTLTQATTQKKWSPANFKLDIKGLDASRVASIDSFTWTCAIAADGSVQTDVSDLAVTFPRAGAAAWKAWYDAMLNGAGDERDGTLTLIGANGGAVMTLSLSNLGLYRLADAVGGVRAEMYCETLGMHASGGGWTL